VRRSPYTFSGNGLSVALKSTIVIDEPEFNLTARPALFFWDNIEAARRGLRLALHHHDLICYVTSGSEEILDPIFLTARISGNT